MKKSTVYLITALAIGTAIGSTYVITKNYFSNALAQRDSLINDLKDQLNNDRYLNHYDFETMPSEPVTNDYAQQLIENYNCEDTTLRNSNNVTIKGWHIERDLIETLFRAYEDRGVDGIQVYLGKHNETNNKSHTLIWMAVKDTTIGTGPSARKSMKLLTDKPRTVFQYVKPCPLNCPENDYTYRCD